MVEGRLAGGAYPFRRGDGLGLLRSIEEARVDVFVNLTQDTATGSPEAGMRRYRDLVADGTLVAAHPISDFGIPSPPQAEMIRSWEPGT
ncbi:MAG: hypothetical protein OEX04_05400 [Acidimicrobiia bacterium]|nr:hypothetical protein [Acidimicrobiia bacterium]MDH4306895.1 hypothetical protein [Acidimicrobiia bacterium]